MREIRSSGSVRDGVGNDPAYSACRLGDRSRLAARIVERVEPGERVGLEDCAIIDEMTPWMLATAVAGVEVDRCRRTGSNDD